MEGEWGEEDGDMEVGEEHVQPWHQIWQRRKKFIVCEGKFGGFEEE